MKIQPVLALLLFCLCLASKASAQGQPECSPCLLPPCPPGYQSHFDWNWDDFCKDDTALLVAQWSSLVVPEYFVWTLVDSFEYDPMWIGPTNNDSVYVLGLGLMCLYIIDTSGCCTGTFGMWPGDLPLEVQVDVVIDSSYCNESTGAIELTLLDTPIPTDTEYIEWENGSTQWSISNLAPGDYSVTITRHNVQGWDCLVEYTFTIPSLNTLTVSGQVTDDFSCIEGNGNIDLHIHPPGIPYDYEWSNGMDIEDVLNLGPGTYTVTITGPPPCEGTGTFTVLEVSEPIQNATAVVLPASCDLPTGTATVTVIGGTPPYTFEWSNGSTENPATGLTPGEYTVTVTGWGDCIFELTIDVPNEDALLQADFQVTGNTYCDEPDGFVDLTMTLDGDYYVYEWSNGSPLEDLYDVPGGVYTITISAGSCTIMDSVIVPENTLHHTLTNSVVSSICGDTSGAINLTVTGGDSPFTYLWSNDSTSQDLTGLTGNWYTVTVTGQNGCVETDSILVPNLNNIFSIAHMITPNSSCADSNGMIDLEVIPPGMYGFQWSTGSLLEDAMNLTSGAYTVTVSHSSGCKTIQQLIVSDSLPVPDTTSLQLVTCAPADTGQFVVMTIGNDGCDSVVLLSYALQPLDTFTVSVATCDPANVGVFITHAVNEGGCDSITQITAYFSPADTTYYNAARCDPESVGITSEHFFNQEGCDSMVVVTTTLLPSDSIVLAATTCDISAVGVFIDYLVNQFGCDSIRTTHVTLLPSHSTSISTTTCLSSEAGIFSDTFSNVHGCDSIITNIISLLPGDTTLILTSTCFQSEVGTTQNVLGNQFGCDSVVIESVVLFPLPEVELHLELIFSGYPISCYGATDGMLTANGIGMAPFQYTWSTGDMEAELTGLSAGAYAVTLIDVNGCVAINAITLTQPEALTMVLTISHPGCFVSNEGSIAILSQGGVAPIQYSIDGINFQPSPVFDQLPGGMFTIIAKDANDCTVSEIVLINAPVSITVEAGDDQTILAGDSAIIHVIANVPYAMLANIEWTNLIDPTCPTCLSQVVTPVITTSYSINVTSLDGCTASDSMTVSVSTDAGIFIPNVFSPNGDQINDRFYISTTSGNMEIASLVIFDRWGNQVYAAQRFPTNDPQYAWDGTFRNQPLNPGVYAYRAVVLVRGRLISMVGNITLLR